MGEKGGVRGVWEKLRGRVERVRERYGLNVTLSDVSLRKGHKMLRILHAMYNYRTGSNVKWVDYNPWEEHTPLWDELRRAYEAAGVDEWELFRLFGVTEEEVYRGEYGAKAGDRREWPGGSADDPGEREHTEEIGEVGEEEWEDPEYTGEGGS